MRRLLLISAFQLFSFSAFATYFYASGASVAAYAPTNNSGVTNKSWWVAEGQFNTNSSGKLSNWVDAGVSPKNLTNTATTDKWPRMTNGIINGLAAVHFYNDDAVYLKNHSYTSSQPHEITMVFRYTDTLNSQYHYLFDSTSLVSQNAAFLTSGNVLVGYGGSSVGNIPFTANKWMVLSILYNGASSGIWTNGKCATGTVNIGAQNADGIILGIASDFSLRSPIQIAEIVTSTSLGAVDALGVFNAATARSNVFWYFTNKYQWTNFQ